MNYRNIAALTTVAFASTAFGGFNALINEFHYDNASGDVGEFIEIVTGQNVAAMDLNVHLYNGNGGAEYNLFNVAADFVDHGILADGFHYYSITLPSNGIQNGAPDGIALSMAGIGLEFLSYEGDFAGVGGIFDGVMSTDIGASEGSGNLIGSSIQRQGFGSGWLTTDGTNTQGMMNVPAPAAMALLGLAGIASRRRRRA